MEKSLKEQALEAAQAAETSEAESSNEESKSETSATEEATDQDTQKQDKQDDSESKTDEGNNPDSEEDSSKPVQKDESKPSILEIDGEKITPEDVRKWREDSLNKDKWQSDLTQKAQEVSSIKDTLDQMKKIFVKEDKSEELTPEEESFREQADTLFKDPYVQNLIQSEINKGIEQRTKEELARKQEEEKKQFQENLVGEIKKLEKELDGTDGRPKYSDSEILTWQKENNKLYLHPKEAYELKYKNELIEWEVQKRLKNKGGDAPKSHQTSASSEKKIDGEKHSLPSDQFTRGKAMLETLKNMVDGE